MYTLSETEVMVKMAIAHFASILCEKTNKLIKTNWSQTIILINQHN